MTKTKVTAKLRSGASAPRSPAETATPSKKTPSRAAEGLERAAPEERAKCPSQRDANASPSNPAWRQAAARAKKETMRTIDAPQAKSQAGTGRSCREARAWASGRSVVTDLRATRRSAPCGPPARLRRCPPDWAGKSKRADPPASTSSGDVVAVDVDFVADVGIDLEANPIALDVGQVPNAAERPAVFDDDRWHRERGSLGRRAGRLSADRRHLRCRRHPLRTTQQHDGYDNERHAEQDSAYYRAAPLSRRCGQGGSG